MKKEITQLQQKMAEMSIDYYLVPTSDYHHSEYISNFLNVGNTFPVLPVLQEHCLSVRHRPGSGRTADIIFRHNRNLPAPESI